jgi:hypothetical protein
MIALNPLRDLDGTDAMALLRSTGQFVYPITINGETNSSVTIAQVEGEWVAASFGSPTEARARSSVKDSQSQGPGASPRILKLDLWLQMAPATEILRWLQPIAKRIDPDVPN